MHNRRAFLSGTAAALSLVRSSPAQAKRRGPKNILLISSDEHRYDAMSCAGHPVLKTPSLDRLASQGVRLTRAYCSAPLCAPTRQSLMTGLMPNEHGQLGNQFVFNRQHLTLFDLAAQAGVHTIGFGKMHVNNGLEEAGDGCHGMRRFDGGATCKRWYISELRARMKQSIPPGRMDPQDEEIFSRLQQKDHRFWGMPLDETSLLPDERISELAHQALDTLPQDKPWLMYVSFRQPHHFWTLPRANYYRYALELIDDPIVPQAQTRRDREKSARYGWDQMSANDIRTCKARYYGGVDYIDAKVGALIEHLDHLGLGQDTVVAYVSDHGEQLGEHGLWFKGVMREPSARIPVILRAPGLQPATESAVKLTTVDLLPTLMGLADWKLPLALPDGQPITGQDLSPALLGQRPGPELSYSMMADPRGVGLAMVRSDTHKLVRHAGGAHKPDHLELYDLAEDSHELRPLEPTVDLAQELNHSLDQWLAERQERRFPLERVKKGA